jgi:fatty-acid desaturase
MMKAPALKLRSTKSPAEKLRAGALLALLHALPVVALIIGPTTVDWLLFAVLYPFSAIGVGVALHRYFAHRAFSTSRIFQFMLALMAASAFGDPIRFAGKHRLHHRFVDTDKDVHTPLAGIWHCWIGSLLDGYPPEELDHQARDLMRYPELRLLHKYAMVPGLVLATGAFIYGGITMVGIGVCLGPVILVHQSSAVNYLCHRFGSRRYDSEDTSTNNALVAIATFGEGWHNNHHQHPTSARAGEAWWEIDLFYNVIQLFSVLGLVWNVRGVKVESQVVKHG